MSDANQNGRFVWRDLMTSDPEKSEAFYTNLFGWTINPQEMGELGTYRMLRNGEKDFGGVYPMDSSDGRPSHWLSYIATPSVDDTVAKASGLGSTVVVQPTDIPGVGRFAVAIDPQGAPFSPFTDTSGSDNPPDGKIPGVGEVAWNELMSKDAQASKSYYAQLFGYTLEEQTMGQPYTILKRGDIMEAGLMQAPDDAPGSRWTIYFQVANIDDSLAKLEQLGGQNLSGIIPVPMGRVAMVSDPVGAMFGLFESKLPA